MLMESEQADASAGQKQLEEKVAEAIHPREVIKRLFECLRVVPWVSFGAIGTGCGIALLYFYFGSIDFVPADIPAILSASLLVGMLAFAFCIWVLVCLISPLWAYQGTGLREHVKDEKPRLAKRSLSGLWALQFLGVGALLFFLGVRYTLDCKPLSREFLALGGVLAVIGITGWALHEMKTIGRRASWWRRLYSATWVCMWAVIAFAALLPVLVPNQEVGWLHIGVFFAVWLVVVALSSTLLDGVPAWGSAIFAAFMLPVLLYSIPTFQGRPSLLPTQVAELAGIRSKQVSELRVPRSTCELIASALGSAIAKNPVVCSGEWGTVHAQVLSNLCAQWLIELQLAGVQPDARNSALRLTISGEGVQKLRFVAAPLPRSKICPA